MATFTKIARVKDACADCGRTDVPHHARGFCFRCYQRGLYAQRVAMRGDKLKVRRRRNENIQKSEVL